jgi:hypothetical protein
MQPATESAAKATSTEPDSGKSTSKAINPGEVRVASRTRSSATNNSSVSKQNVSRVKRSSGTGKTSKSGSGKTSTKKAGVTNKGKVGQSGTGKMGKAASTKTGTGTNSTSGTNGKIGTGPGKTGSGVSATGTNSTSGTNGKIGTGPGQIGSGAKRVSSNSTSTRAQIKAGLDAHPGVPATGPTLPANPANAAKAGTIIKHTGTPVGEVIKPGTVIKHTGVPTTTDKATGVTTTTNKVTGITTKTNKDASVTVTTNNKTGITTETDKNTGINTTSNSNTGLITATNKNTGVTTTTNFKTEITTTTDKNTGITTKTDRAGDTETDNKKTGIGTTTIKSTGETTTTNNNTGITTKTNKDASVTTIINKNTGIATTTNKNTGVTTTTNINTGVATTTKAGGGDNIGPVAGVLGGMSSNSTPINNQGVTIFRGPRRVWIGGEERFFVAASVLPGLYLGSDYYTPQGYVAVAQPACYGKTAEGCLLRWQQVPLESGGSDVQCVQLCRSGGVAQGAAAQPTAAVAQAFDSEPMAPAPAQAQTAGGCEVAIYADANFAGQATATVENQPRLGDVGWKGEIASVRVKGGTWDFFSDDDYGGQTMRLPPGEYAQFGPPWTKQISSFMCLGQQPNVTDNQNTRTENLRVALGDTIAKVRAAYGITADPIPTNNHQAMLRAPSDGLTLFFNEKELTLRNIRADVPFSGSIDGVRIGDVFDDVVARLGQPYAGPLDVGNNKAYVFRVGPNLFRASFNNTQKLETMFEFVKNP